MADALTSCTALLAALEKAGVSADHQRAAPYAVQEAYGLCYFGDGHQASLDERCVLEYGDWTKELRMPGGTANAQLPDSWVEVAGLSAGAQGHGGGPGTWQPQPAQRGLEAPWMPAISDISFNFAVPAMGAAALPPPLPPVRVQVPGLDHGIAFGITASANLKPACQHGRAALDQHLMKEPATADNLQSMPMATEAV
eukprot:366483-Chlamydomonas_euryale.AAC.7